MALYPTNSLANYNLPMIGQRTPTSATSNTKIVRLFPRKNVFCCFRDTFLVPLINCGTSFYAGFVIFSSLGFMAHNKGVSVKDVAKIGTVTIPTI